MKAKKWNFEKKTYEPYELPKSASIYEEDLDKVISCAECGSKIKFGNGYTSKAIHTEFGFGYSVCERCSQEEVQKEIKKQRKEVGDVDGFKEKAKGSNDADTLAFNAIPTKKEIKRISE